jgi:hypothetical protein
MPSKNPMIGVRVKPELYFKIRAKAESEGRALSNFVAKCLADHFATQPPAKRPRRTNGSTANAG